MGFLDILFPKGCVGCGKWGGYVCEGCEIGMWEEEQVCPVCCRNSRYGMRHRYCRGSLDGLTCLWAYEGVAKKVISGAKYRGWYDRLEFLISNFSFDSAQDKQFFYFQKFLEGMPAVVPVPLYPKRERERGFNQAKIISLSLSKIWGLEVKEMLVRVRDTGQQVGRSREERTEAVRGAFEVSNRRVSHMLSAGPIIRTGFEPRDATPSGYLHSRRPKTEHSSSWVGCESSSESTMRNSHKHPDLPRNVLLVDDVWTTGATMNECAGTLKKAGVKRIWGLVLAR